ncbi:MAG: tRNA (adenosine(37)-N6)-threonylcarbamoyltransferase complex ATPase subunit type 1 TsaE [Planctomycetes bacterium]|nr:tRNA (adenosine(37)-N6)-threonylcarbamoyltransferase complex ATPase subunit type 1 TsaE [Planctomycetota bacterium]
MEIVTRSVEETLRLGEELGRRLGPGDLVALVGTLGAGKTYFTKGIARGCGVPNVRVVQSPTFVLLRIYRGGRVLVYHYDAYRLESPYEALRLAWEEREEGVTVVEWGDKLAEVLREDHFVIELEPAGETVRRFTFGGKGARVAAICAALAAVHAAEAPADGG